MIEADPNLGEKAISKVAEIGISSQLEQVENINVDIRIDLGRLVQGELDSVVISGQGLVVKQDLRMERLEVVTDNVAINPLSAAFGTLELSHPTAAEAQIVLTESDINRALNSDYARSNLRRLQIQLEGQPVTVYIKKAAINLPGDNKLSITCDFLLEEKGELKKLSAIVIPKIQDNGYRISLEVVSAEGQGLTAELVIAIFEQLITLLDLRNFGIPGISLQLRRLDIQQGKLIIDAKTHIEQIPA